eukprot:CAMPEP_0185809274 /NCGR_PEP_ID=MMETSP1322-20130828/6111_1 /TAXON_ID=265543 /ORGANISM="Minutocellus polymorphus, Strain RCC2270" /LENGTH=336 /DNA_ID=CAMNT_0028505537 /DNA_START=125 /DNA_END=1135 /DNA_ORIENTATION=+
MKSHPGAPSPQQDRNHLSSCVSFAVSDFPLDGSDFGWWMQQPQPSSTSTLMAPNNSRASAAMGIIVSVIFNNYTRPAMQCTYDSQHNCSRRVAKPAKQVGQRKGKDDAGFRIDMISDGDGACGFAWTWTCGDEEGLRGTTFVELNDAGEIQFVREIPEPLFKPGDATKDLLQAVTAGIEPTPKPDFESQTPTTASGIARYLYEEVQGGSVDEAMRFFSPDVEYRDFNYEEMLNGKEDVRKFIEDFSFPGITFRPQRFDDGVLSTCFCWEVVIADAPETIKGMSLYRIDPETRLINYVRDVPESAVKPPILGKLARDLRPGLGVFAGVKLGSRPGGK